MLGKAALRLLPRPARRCVRTEGLCPGEPLAQPTSEDGEVLHRASLYVHWPFCKRRCTYCNFNKYISPNVDQNAMRDGLVQETETLLRDSQVKEITSVFFGGGTPSLAKPSTIASILETVAKASRLSHNIEVSLEANPTSVSTSKLAEFKKAGVTRISIGIQLTLERGTALFKQVQEKVVSMPEQDVVANMYHAARSILEKAGFHQYEVSNFAKNGAVSLHNLGYWKGMQYLGVGPGAHGRFVPWGEGKTQREARIQTLEPDNWLREVRHFGHGTRKRVQQSELDVLEEMLVLGLRMNEGLAHQCWRQYSPLLSLEEALGDSPEVQQYLQEELLILDDRALRCSWKGLAFLDSLLPSLLHQLQHSYQNPASHCF
ncbi:radical S-adenosyl methionine domain-containing protein 1, mitochondrial isoform X2 [Rhinoraja longicauda]